MCCIYKYMSNAVCIEMVYMLEYVRRMCSDWIRILYVCTLRYIVRNISKQCLREDTQRKHLPTDNIFSSKISGLAVSES
jgi:hypothetical protein